MTFALISGSDSVPKQSERGNGMLHLREAGGFRTEESDGWEYSDDCLVLRRAISA